MGIILSMQPAFEYFWGGSGMYGKRLGARSIKTNAFKTIQDNGGIIIGGSDSDVTPINPLLGIQGTITHPTQKSRVDVLEALKMFTINGAYGVFQENIRGTITLGKIADFVVLDKNPLTTEPEK